MECANILNKGISPRNPRHSIAIINRVPELHTTPTIRDARTSWSFVCGPFRMSLVVDSSVCRIAHWRSMQLSWWQSRCSIKAYPGDERNLHDKNKVSRTILESSITLHPATVLMIQLVWYRGIFGWRCRQTHTLRFLLFSQSQLHLLWMADPAVLRISKPLITGHFSSLVTVQIKWRQPHV